MSLVGKIPTWAIAARDNDEKRAKAASDPLGGAAFDCSHGSGAAIPAPSQHICPINKCARCVVLDLLLVMPSKSTLDDINISLYV
jgi:hypothetical protein